MTENTNCSDCSSCSYCSGCLYCSDCSVCYASSGLRLAENMIFCLGNGKNERNGIGYQKNNLVFNKPVDDFYDALEAYNALAIDLDLRNNSYQKAWQKWWNANPDKHKPIKEFPNFDAKIFKSITGIDVEEPVILEKDGKRYEVQIIREL